MAVRQYIGARYVPRFVGDYDVTQSYEALDVVDNGQGTSYIAKKPTPAGTPLTDTNYWFLYGSTSGAILHLQDQIDDMQDGAVPGSLQEQINTNTSDITALQNKDPRTNFFNNKKILVIGDSLSDPTVQAPNWLTLFKNEVEAMGATVDSTFCIDGMTLANFAISQLSNLDSYANEWDIVILALGVNDYQAQYFIGSRADTTVHDTNVPNNYNSAAAMHLIINKLLNKFPKALMYYCIPHRTARQLSNSPVRPLTYYRNAFGRMTQYHGFRIIDWSSMPMFAPAANGNTFGGYTTASDVLHPSNVYAPILKEFMIEQLMNGGANDWKDSWDQIRIPYGTGLGATGNGRFYVSSHGKLRLEEAIAINFSSNSAHLFDDFPIPIQLFSTWARVNGKPAPLTYESGNVVVHKPSGETTATTLYLEAEVECPNPMSYYANVLD